jgi:hypothetical protein
MTDSIYIALEISRRYVWAFVTSIQVLKRLCLIFNRVLTGEIGIGSIVILSQSLSDGLKNCNCWRLLGLIRLNEPCP